MSGVYTLDASAFERTQQVEEYVLALKRRMLPLKFAYIGRAAHTHDRLVRSREYGLADAEAALIRASFSSSILPRLHGSGLNIVDVGSGNGIKALVVIEALNLKLTNLRYVGLDYSDELLRIAERNISARLPDLNISMYSIDFEQGDFRDIVERVQTATGYSSLLLLLGHTLGNPVNRYQTLKNVHDSLGPSDALLVGLELYHPDKVKAVLEHYRNEPFHRAVFNPLTFVGFHRSDGILTVSFNESTKDVEVHFQLAKDIEVRIGPSEVIHFRKGEDLLIFLSHRFDEKELQGLFASVGLRVIEMPLNVDHTYALVIAGSAR